MQANLEVTINDREWPELILVAKVGLSVTTRKVRFDVATVSFTEVVSQFVEQAVKATIDRRKSYGNAS